MTVSARVPVDLDALRAKYLDAQLAGNRREAMRLVTDEALARGIGIVEIEDRVIREAQREIGRLWQENQITIADEHMATAISTLVLAHLYERAARVPDNGVKVLVACVEGELHDLPARLVADALDLAGFDVKFLGASVPLDHLFKMLDRAPPDLLVLSATMSFHAPALRETARVVRERYGSALRLAVGGGACMWSPTLAAEVGAEIEATSAPELVVLAARLFDKRAEEER